MLDSTIVPDSEPHCDGYISPTILFPFIESLLQGAKSQESSIDGTLDYYGVLQDPYENLNVEIYQAFLFAKHTFAELEDAQLQKAFLEARILAASQIFGSELLPSVSVDPYGEFTFCHKSEAGYVDIGVRGEGELSYHVRNDVEPENTTYDDFDWTDYKVPRELFEALQTLQRQLWKKS
ncbi:hypothetical protein FLO80_21105 [Aquicoccus porphyridii]|uniref:Uncharacterized protein n=1 Tax=Aquicoccus porphyridii TaxID=1852029 RepID=A0A5A9YX96_9RHOB|nr:hypothetical protein [Aquicoccus porphyridii]KAA0909531.1 hypothetical protein FLO80_21105 [Aquicoccus porphyridii]RAI51809.1 hypothetical protein DOO74_21215 [Rhodobacteraceae bacterium AsT-22]